MGRAGRTGDSAVCASAVWASAIRVPRCLRVVRAGIVWTESGYSGECHSSEYGAGYGCTGGFGSGYRNSS